MKTPGQHLDELVRKLCETNPKVTGRITYTTNMVGGTLSRKFAFAVEESGKDDGLVLSIGVGPFDPSHAV